MTESDAPAAVLAGGGGGTLRAVIEGVCDACGSAGLPGPERVRVGALRMGSGNLLAKQFGVPSDPEAGLYSLQANLKAGLTVPCCVMCCETWIKSGESQIHHGVTLGGLGQFGRIPSDLARWHAKFPFIHTNAARWFGVENLTNVEYAFALLLRSIRCSLFPKRAETIEINLNDQTERLRLLSGVVMNFPMNALPFKPDISAEDEAALVYLIPANGRFYPLLQVVAPQRLKDTRNVRLEKDQRLEIRFPEQDRVEFFLDEDPVTTYKRLRLGIAGSIAFIPGTDYRQIDTREART
jgi:diacylglycerol kinase family enzyme